MAARDHLREDESILAQFPPFYATTHRILRCETNGGQEECHELPYHHIATVEIIRRPLHRIAVPGVFVALSGVFLWSLGFYTAVPTVALGVALILWGARGREAYYQFRGYDMPEQEQRRWRVTFRGSAGFIIAVGEHVRRPMNW